MGFERCTKCILPADFPGITFNDLGVCQYCDDDQDNLDFPEIRSGAEAAIRSLVGSSPHYDIALAFSGGKDSTYALVYLKEQFPGAKIAAITVDNDFLSQGAWRNCFMMPSVLGIDHIILRPDPKSMREVFRVSVAEDLYGIAALKRASSICNSCIQIINTQILTFATNYGVPLIMGGYIGGQVPSHSGIMEQRLAVMSRMREQTLERLRKVMNPDAVRLFEQRIGLRSVFTIVNPLIYLNPSEKEILEKISLFGWQKPEDTGKSSTNCLLNDYAIYEHIKKCGFHPYIFEIATMVRKGIMAREEALRKIDVTFSADEFTLIRKKLGLES